MTSNVGASLISTTSKLGFSTDNDGGQKDKYEHLKDTVNEELKKAFRPEFLNRIDEIIVFAHLQKPEIREIAELMLKDLFGRIKERQLNVTITDEVKDFLAEEGYSESYGARPLRRLIQKKIEDVLAEGILSGEYNEGDEIFLKLNDKKIILEKENKTLTK
jgi:ATP-dependent Clp protease ATP-binding subunit ClpC